MSSVYQILVVQRFLVYISRYAKLIFTIFYYVLDPCWMDILGTFLYTEEYTEDLSIIRKIYTENSLVIEPKIRKKNTFSSVFLPYFFRIFIYFFFLIKIKIKIK